MQHWHTVEHMDAHHYMKGKHITEIEANPTDSGTWKWIVSSKDKAIQCMKPISVGHAQTSDTRLGVCGQLAYLCSNQLGRRSELMVQDLLSLIWNGSLIIVPKYQLVY